MFFSLPTIEYILFFCQNFYWHAIINCSSFGLFEIRISDDKRNFVRWKKKKIIIIT